MIAKHSPNGKRIWLTFKYDKWDVETVKRIPGATYVPRDKGGPAWSFPLTVKSGKLLRERLGPRVRFSEELKAWGREERRRTIDLRNLSLADDAHTPVLQERHKALAEYLRPYQRADVALMARNNIVNANEMGLGKSVEVIAAIHESGLEKGANLIIAPRQSLEVVWADEIEKWIDNPDDILTADNPADRKRMITVARVRQEQGRGFWLILNPEMVRYKNVKGEKKPVPINPELFKIKFDTVTIDEFHKAALVGRNLSSRGFKALKTDRKWALSGTPIGGVPINFFGAFHWLDPVRFSGRWQWAKQWLEVKHNGFGHDIGGIANEEEFYAEHAPYLLRRRKREVLPELPPKIYETVLCRMTKAQEKQYRKFEADAEIKIDTKRLTGTSILAEYSYLKMFASARCEIRDGVLYPTTESGKLEALFDRLQRHNVHEKNGEFAIVGTQFARYARVTAEYLEKQGIKAALITGETSEIGRAEVIRRFAKGEGPHVLVLVSTAGTSLNLQKADSVHILDETWNPDDQLQLEDRGDRGSRTKGLCVYYYRTRDTIEEKVSSVTSAKQITSENILDIRRNEWK